MSSEFTASDVAECLAGGLPGEEKAAALLAVTGSSVEGYGQWSGLVVVRCESGRIALITGWCDTSGWG